MSYQERRALASLVGTVLISAIYLVVVLPRYPQGNPYSVDVFHFWGSSILILIPVSIAANIAIHIQFNIITNMATSKKEDRLSDERDKLIQLRAVRNSTYVFVSGFFLAMGSLVIDMPPSAMFMILVSSGIVSGLVGAISELYFYRRGF